MESQLGKKQRLKKAVTINRGTLSCRFNFKRRQASVTDSINLSCSKLRCSVALREVFQIIEGGLTQSSGAAEIYYFRVAW
ncbi:hypothetical protein N8597_01535 [Akkermansiaceae bacterium]|nr:hypothetical protein [Akkermansiaceae bacterium]